LAGVGASESATQNQALAAIIFLYKLHVLGPRMGTCLMSCMHVGRNSCRW